MYSRLTKITGRLLLVFLGAALTMTCFAVTPANAAEIDIDPAPYVINIGDAMYTFVIHTDIPYGRVADPAAVTVNGALIYAWKIDSLGCFDAFVRVEDLSLEAGGLNTLLLEGVDTDGDAFFGTEDVWVIDRAGGLGKIR